MHPRRKRSMAAMLCFYADGQFGLKRGGYVHLDIGVCVRGVRPKMDRKMNQNGPKFVQRGKAVGGRAGPFCHGLLPAPDAPRVKFRWNLQPLG
eukprot:412721-Prorocentrum_minimum.AAC.1